jgi:hypothetical protein
LARRVASSPGRRSPAGEGEIGGMQVLIASGRPYVTVAEGVVQCSAVKYGLSALLGPHMARPIRFTAVGPTCRRGAARLQRESGGARHMLLGATKKAAAVRVKKNH